MSKTWHDQHLKTCACKKCALKPKKIPDKPLPTGNDEAASNLTVTSNEPSWNIPNLPTLGYYDTDGNEIDLLTWAELFGKRSQDPDTSWWKKATAISDEIQVSSVWIGTDQGFWLNQDLPLIYETMIFGGPRNSEQWRYATKEECWQDHDRIVKELLTDMGLDPAEDSPSPEARKNSLPPAKSVAVAPDPEAWFHSWG